MRVLCIDPGGDALDFCMRAQNAGHDVKHWMRSIRETEYIGRGLVTRVADWREHIASVELVFLSDNTHWLRELDAWRDRGTPIFGCNRDAASLELDRETGQKVLKAAGIETLPYKTFNAAKPAVAYVKARMAPLVSKPNADADKGMSYVAKTPEDMVYMLERWDRLGKLKGEFILQDYVPGCEMAVGGWFGPGGWNRGWCENFEFKKMMDGDLGVNTGEQGTVLRYVANSKLAKKVLEPMGDWLESRDYCGYIDVNCIIDDEGNPWPLEFTCYDDETSVLTENGWKLFKDVSVGENVASLNPATRVAEYHPAVDVIARPYVGEMIEFAGTSYGVNLCVTPDHAMWVRNQHADAFSFEPAARIARGGLWEVVRTARFEAPDRADFTLPAYVEHHWLGRHQKRLDITHQPITVAMDDWLRFLGLYISEGSMSKKYQISISQPGGKRDVVGSMLKALPFNVQETKNGFQICSVQLGTWIKDHIPGLCNSKRIPREFMSLSPRQSGILLDALMLGDGAVHKRSDGRSYYTTSPSLADDVLELMTRMGNLGRIAVRGAAGTAMAINGQEYVRRYDSYVVSEKTVKKTGWIDPRQATRKRYSGTVYCLNVPPHHLLLVKRRGNVTWSGNCRPGWPTFNIQQVLLDGDPVDWMMETLEGSDPTCWELDRVALGVVMTIPDYPFSHVTRKEVVGVPVYGVTPAIAPNIHPLHIMLGEMPVEIGGKIVTVPGYVTGGDYVLATTGTGETILEAKTMAYRIMRRLKLPNSPQFRTDIGDRLKKQLPDCQRHGYATGLLWDSPKS
jgi:phosphoribosylamine-glycine ligase